jgi:hypothetical protein
LAVWLLSYGFIFFCVKPVWRHASYKTDTSKEYALPPPPPLPPLLLTLFLSRRYCRHAFFESYKEDAEHRLAVFDFHPTKWIAYKEEVKTYTHANWATWKREAPPWFDEELLVRIDDEFIPAAEVQALNAAAEGGQRRRSSINTGGNAQGARRGSRPISILLESPALRRGSAYMGSPTRSRAVRSLPNGEPGPPSNTKEL